MTSKLTIPEKCPECLKPLKFKRLVGLNSGCRTIRCADCGKVLDFHPGCPNFRALPNSRRFELPCQFCSKPECRWREILVREEH